MAYALVRAAATLVSSLRAALLRCLCCRRGAHSKHKSLIMFVFPKLNGIALVWVSGTIAVAAEAAAFVVVTPDSYLPHAINTIPPTPGTIYQLDGIMVIDALSHVSETVDPGRRPKTRPQHPGPRP